MVGRGKSGLQEKPRDVKKLKQMVSEDVLGAIWDNWCCQFDNFDPTTMEHYVEEVIKELESAQIEPAAKVFHEKLMDVLPKLVEYINEHANRPLGEKLGKFMEPFMKGVMDTLCVEFDDKAFKDAPSNLLDRFEYLYDGDRPGYNRDSLYLYIIFFNGEFDVEEEIEPEEENVPEEEIVLVEDSLVSQPPSTQVSEPFNVVVPAPQPSSSSLAQVPAPVAQPSEVAASKPRKTKRSFEEINRADREAALEKLRAAENRRAIARQKWHHACDETNKFREELKFLEENPKATHNQWLKKQRKNDSSAPSSSA